MLLISLDPRMTFEEIVVGLQNRLAHDASLAVVANPGKAYNPLFIYGPAGVGKTHLLQAIAHRLLQKNPELKYLYTSADRLTVEISQALEQDKIPSFREKYQSLDLFLVDDVQFLSESESTQAQFFPIFNTLQQQGKQVVLASDRAPSKLTVLDDRMRSRLSSGLAADIKPPDLETRMNILRRKQTLEGVQLEEDLLSHAAKNLSSNVRELEGFLKRMKAHRTFVGGAIDMTLVTSVVKDLASLPLGEEAEGKALREESLPAGQAVPEEEAPEVPHKEVEAVVFCPKGYADRCSVVDQQFRDVIQKHKLHFSLKMVHTEFYDPQGKLNPEAWAEFCKTRLVSVALFIGPPPDSSNAGKDFAENLA